MDKMPTPDTQMPENGNRIFCADAIQSADGVLSETPRTTYPQDWEAYNDAQTNEKVLFLRLLSELTDQIAMPARIGPGRPCASLGDMIFSCCVKLYLNFSSRRTESDLKIAEQLGYLSHTPHFNTILKYLNDPNLSGLLTQLVEFSALPLQQIEERFAADSTGFSTSVFDRWYGTPRKNEEQRMYLKAHVMCGVRTNVITAVMVTPGTVSDFDMFPALVDNTAKRFRLKEVYADKGYSSRKNLEAVANHGGIPYIAFRRNTVKPKPRKSVVWRDMVRFFRDHKDEFMAHYHLRSNVESTFSMMKRKQGTYLRTKSFIAQKNELLCKVLVHNICVLIQEIFESGVKVDFEALAGDELMCKSLT